MKLCVTLLLALAACPVCAMPVPESFTVNGLTVIVAPGGATDIVAAGMYFRGGSSVLDAREAGIEALALRVATHATKNYPKGVLDAALEGMDTHISPAAGRDYASLSLQCVRENFPRSWKIFADMILNPSFDSADVELERDQMLAGIRQSKDNPDQYLSTLAMEAFYVDNPYAVDPSGSEATVRSFSRGDLQAFMKSKVTAHGMLLVVVGNTTRSEVEGMVRESFANLPAGSERTPEVPAASFQAPSVKIVRRELPTSYIMGCYNAPRFGSAESYAMILAESILQDRLFEEVRTKRSLSYAPGAGLGGLFTNYGLIYVTAVRPDTTLNVMIGEMKKLQDEPVTEKALEDQRNVYLTRYYLTTETNEAQVNFIARYELSGAGYAEAGRYLENIRGVTPEAVQAACRKYFHNLQFVLIGAPPEIRLGSFSY